MTIIDKTALMETGLKPKRQVEPSVRIKLRRDKLFNLSQFQNGSHRMECISFTMIQASFSHMELQ